MPRILDLHFISNKVITGLLDFLTVDSFKEGILHPTTFQITQSFLLFYFISREGIGTFVSYISLAHSLDVSFLRKHYILLMALANRTAIERKEKNNGPKFKSSLLTI